MASPWKILVKVPPNHPDTFLSTVRLTSLEALRSRLGDEFYMEALRQISEQPSRSDQLPKTFHLQCSFLIQHFQRHRHSFSDNDCHAPNLSLRISTSGRLTADF